METGSTAMGTSLSPEYRLRAVVGRMDPALLPPSPVGERGPGGEGLEGERRPEREDLDGERQPTASRSRRRSPHSVAAGNLPLSRPSPRPRTGDPLPEW